MSVVHRVRALSQAGLGTLGERFSVRSASIRGKVTRAFVGVVALLLPQIVLTVFYLLSLFNHGDRVVHLANGVREVARLTAQAEDLLPERAPRSEEELADALSRTERMASALSQTVERVAPLRDLVPETAGPVDELAGARRTVDALGPLLRRAARRVVSAPPPDAPGLATVAGATTDLAERLASWADLKEGGSPPPPAERSAWLEDFSVRVLGYLLGELTAGQAQAALTPPPFERDDLRIGQSKRRVLDTLARAETALTAGGAAAGAAIREDVDEANRFLVTLVLITLVYLGVIAVVLPGRLVRPLAHLQSVMERAGRGRLDVRARVVGGDEISAVSASLNGLLERLEAFDDLKRDRIALDRRRMDALVDGVPTPVAILNTHQGLEVANTSFRRWFDLDARDLGRPLGDTLRLDDDARTLTAAIDQALRSGKTVEGLQVDILGGEEPRTARVTVTVGQDRAGRTAFAIVWLAPAPPPPHEAPAPSRKST